MQCLNNKCLYRSKEIKQVHIWIKEYNDSKSDTSSQGSGSLSPQIIEDKNDIQCLFSVVNE